jgi:hypothetical protein
MIPRLDRLPEVTAALAARAEAKEDFLSRH